MSEGFAQGKLSYIQIPATDTSASASFYTAAFGWQVRGEGTDHLSFTDATGDMIGAWVTGREPSTEPGVLPYISVDDVDVGLARINEHGGTAVREPYAEGALTVATFRDPAGNVIGIWHMPA